MPAVSGFEFLERLRAEQGGARIPVPVWTSKDVSREEHAVLRAATQALVLKGDGLAASLLRELEWLLPLPREQASRRKMLLSA